MKQSLPGVMYANDIMLVTDEKEDLQKLIDICGTEEDILGLKFTKEICAVRIFIDEGYEHIYQELTIEVVDQYKYLGEWITVHSIRE